MKTKHLIIILVNFVMVLFSNATLASCKDADLCAVEECRERQSAVHSTCDQKRTCSNIDSSNKDELQRRLTINKQCLGARLNVAKCFSNVDPGHNTQIENIRDAIKICQEKIAEK